MFPRALLTHPPGGVAAEKGQPGNAECPVSKWQGHLVLRPRLLGGSPRGRPTQWRSDARDEATSRPTRTTPETTLHVHAEDADAESQKGEYWQRRAPRRVSVPRTPAERPPAGLGGPAQGDPDPSQEDSQLKMPANRRAAVGDLQGTGGGRYRLLALSAGELLVPWPGQDLHSMGTVVVGAGAEAPGEGAVRAECTSPCVSSWGSVPGELWPGVGVVEATPPPPPRRSYP